MDGTTTIECPAEVTELRERIVQLEHALAERRAFAGKRVEREVEHTVGDKKETYSSVVAPGTSNGRTHGILRVDIDVMDSKTAEHALGESRGLLENRVEQRTAELVQEKEHLRNLLEMHERERRLIGFEIHDGLAQFLSGAMMHLGNFRRMADQGDAGAWSSFDMATALVARGLREARRLIHDLRPPDLEEGGILAAVGELISDAREQWGVEIQFVHQFAVERLAAPLEHAIYRVVQEALMNACRHSQSDEIRVTLCQQEDRMRICVEDWGVGFDPDAVAAGHYGLEGLRERARIFGGEVTVDSRPGWGTALSVVLPLSDAGVSSALLVDH